MPNADPQPGQGPDSFEAVISKEEIQRFAGRICCLRLLDKFGEQEREAIYCISSLSCAWVLPWGTSLDRDPY